MGLRGAEDHAPAAYAASFLASQSLAAALQNHQGEETTSPLPHQLIEALSAAQGEEVQEVELVGVPQRHISSKIDLYQLHCLNDGVGEGEVREQARLSSLALPHAGDWLSTAPLTALGLHLRPPEFVLCKISSGTACL